MAVTELRALAINLEPVGVAIFVISLAYGVVGITVRNEAEYSRGNGSNEVQWPKVLVDPRSREVFWFQPQIVPANRTAVPAP